MRTTLNIDDGVLQRASELTGVREKTALVRMGLESLIARQSAATACCAGRHRAASTAGATAETETVILVDTSVWINHFRFCSPLLVKLLDQQRVLLHPFILGEIACGNLTQRKEIISLLHVLPTVQTADHDDILYFIDQHNLMGRGVGLVDVHLLASCMIERCPIWTADKRLKAVAQELETAFDPTTAEHAR